MINVYIFEASTILEIKKSSKEVHLITHGMTLRLSSYKKYHIAGTKIYDNIPLDA
jgi:hypothetical protein